MYTKYLAIEKALYGEYSSRMAAKYRYIAEIYWDIGKL